MSNTIELNTRITEIAEKLEKGMSSKELSEEYAAKWSVSVRTIERYIALAKDIVAGRMQKRDALIEAARSEAIEAATEHLCSEIEMEARLCQIVMGSLETEKVLNTKEGYIKVGCSPTPGDVMKAAEMLFKRRQIIAKEARKFNENEKMNRIFGGGLL
jgi:hypothetical protein